MIYVALAFHNPGYAALAWTGFTVILILSVWSDERRGPAAKLGLSLLAIAAYIPVMLKSLLDSISILLRILRPPRIDPAAYIK